MKKNIAASLMVTFVLMINFALAPVALADAKTPVGSWRLENDTGNRALATFTADGTQIVTVPGASAGHGSWEKIGERTFMAKTIAIGGGNGQPEVTATVTEVLEVSEDAQSYTAQYETVVEVDGLEVEISTGSITASRITSD